MNPPEAGAASLRSVWLRNVRLKRAQTRSAEADIAGSLTLRACLISRLLVWGGGLGAAAIFGVASVPKLVNDPNSATAPFHAGWVNFLIGPAARWDSMWYLQIAHDGYFSAPSSAFFPLYPLLVHLGAGVFGSEIVVAVLISLISMVVAIYLLYLLVRLDLDERAAKTSVLLLAFFPTALFLSAVYTESLFLMLSVGSLYAARRERWAIASALAGLAAASRSNGILLVVPLAILYLYGPGKVDLRLLRRGWSRPQYRLSPSVLWLALVPLGLAGYMAYLGITHGAPLAPFQQLAHWRRESAGPFSAVWQLFGALPHDISRIVSGHTLPVEPGDPISWTVHDLIDLAFLAFALAGLWFARRRVPFAYLAYAVLVLMQSLSYPSSIEPLASFPRYMLVIFPLFMGWGAVLAERPVARRGLLVASSALLVAFSGLFTYWGWVA